MSVTSGGDSLTLKVGDGTFFTDVDDIGNVTTWPFTIANKQIQITAKFAPDASTKDRTVTVNVPRGYKIVEYTALKTTTAIAGVNKLELSAEQEAQLASAALTASDGTSWASQTVSGYMVASSATENPFRVYDGKVVYTFNSNVNEVTLTLTLALDHAILPHATTTATLNPLTVDMVSGTKTLSDQLTTTVSALTTTWIRHTTGAPNVTGTVNTTNDKLGTIDRFITSIQVSPYNAASNIRTYYDDSVTVTVNYPAGVNFEGFKSRALAQDRPNDKDGGTYAGGHLVVTNDRTARTVTFAYSKYIMQHFIGDPTIILYWTAEIDDSTLKWEDKRTFSATLVEDSGAIVGNPQTSSPVTVSEPLITFKKPNVKLTLGRTNFVRRDLNADPLNPFPYDYALGRFTLVNEGPSVAEDITYRFTFAPELAVRGVSIPAGTPATDIEFSSIVATTSLGRTITLSNPPISRSGSYDHLSVYVSPSTLGLADGEYLNTLAVTQKTLAVGSFNSSRTAGGLVYFGRFQGGKSGSATLEITDKTGAVLAAKVTDSPTIGWTYSGAGTLATTASHNAASAVTGSYYTGDNIYFTSTYVAGAVLNPSYNDIVDPDIYIMLPAGVDLDDSSVQAISFAGNHKGVPFDLKAVGTPTKKTIAGVEWTMYRFTSPSAQDIITGANPYRQGAYNQLTVKFTANVASTCEAYAELKPADMVFIDLGTSAASVSDGTSYVQADANNWTGKGTTYNVVGALHSAPLSVVQKPGLSVHLGIRTVSEPSYYIYDGSEASVAKVSKDKLAQIELKYENTDTDVYKANSEIYLPIPKAGKGYDHFFNNISTAPYSTETNAVPQWSAELTGAISLPGFTTFYSTDENWTTNTGTQGIGWTPITATWATAPTDFSKVTMVKFVATTDIASVGNPGSTGGTDFTIKIDNSSDRGKIDYWRSYQKGWRDTDGNGAWIYGSTIAALTDPATLKGRIFDDKNADGVMDSGEEFSALAGVSAELKGGTIPSSSPIAVTVNADGTFALLSGGNPLYLANGNYTLTVKNANSALGTSSQYGFSKTTSTVRSNEAPVGTYNWFMDVPQGKISADHSTATFDFTVSALSDAVELVGVGMQSPYTVTYKAGTGASFGDVSEYRNSNQHPSSGVVPTFSTGTNTVTGYDPATAVWTADKNVVGAFSSGVFILAGAEISYLDVLEVRVAENVTFTATLSLKDYTLQFDRNEGSGTPDIIAAATQAGKHLGDTDVTIAAAPLYTGHTFAGWSLDPAAMVADAGYGTSVAGTDVTLDAARINALFANDTTATTTLYAVWTVRGVDVSYEQNGGSGIAGQLTSGIYDATLATAPTTQPSKAGYTFAGWFWDSGLTNAFTFDVLGTGTPLDTAHGVVDGTGTANATLTLYAKWTARGVDVTYEQNGGSGIAGQLTSGVYGATLASAPTTEPTKTGSVFAGWFWDSGLTNAFTFDVPGTGTPLDTAHGVVDGSGTANATLTLYAKWTVRDVDVIYNTNGGSAPIGALTSGTYGGTLPTGPTTETEKAGHVFAGWFWDSGLTNAFTFDVPGTGTPLDTAHGVVDGATATDNATLTLYAKWTIVGYNINYDLAGGTVSGTNPSGYTVTGTFPITFIQPARTGYTFSGWTVEYANDAITDVTTPNLLYSVPQFYTGTTPTTGDIALTANWTPVSYTISYNLAGGTVIGTNPSGYSVESTFPIIFIQPVREGYVFAGWTVDYTNPSITDVTSPWPTYSVPKYYTGITPTTGDITLSANWAYDFFGYTITHHFTGGPSNGVATVVETGSRAFNTTVVAPATVSYTGYTLDTAHASAVPSGIIFAGTLELHLYYQANIHTVSYNANGGAGAPGTQTGDYLSAVTVAGQGGMTRAGYSFLGWSEDAGAGTPVWGGGGTITLSRNYTLYAVWSLDPTYSVTYAAGGEGVTGLPAGATGLAVGTGVTVGAAPSRTGFVFVGFASSAGGTLQPADYFTMPAANVTLTALWEPQAFTVSYAAGGTNVTGLPAGGTFEVGATVTVGAAPARAGFTFEGWASSAGGTLQPGATFVMPAADVVLTATWDEIIIPTPIPTEPINPTPTTEVPGANPVVTAAVNEGIPVMNIFGNDIPLIRPAGVNAWSLFDLICTLISLAALLIAGIYSIVRKKDRQDDEHEVSDMYLDKDGNVIYEIERRMARPIFLLATAVAAAIAVVLFLWTQDLSAPMVVFDVWSIVFGVLAVLAVILARITFGKKKEDYQPYEPQDGSQTDQPAAGVTTAA